MSKTEKLHLVRCEARAAEPGLGPRRLWLSVTQHRGFPLLSKKRVLADLVFPESAWERHATGEWRNKTPCRLVRLHTLGKKVNVVLPVEVKVWTTRGAVRKTFLDLQLGELLHRLQSCATPLTLGVTCSSVAVHVTCPAEGTAVSQLAGHLASAPVTGGVVFSAAGDVSLQGGTGPQGSLPVLEGVVGTAICVKAGQSLHTEDKSEAMPPHCQNDEKESEPSRPLRFPDSGSVFAQLLKEYEMHDLEAAEANTREDVEEVERPPRRSLMWFNSAVAQVLPLCFIGFFFVNLHRDFIPRVYGTWAFSVQAVVWVSASVTTFVFYCISWMPAGRVTQKDAAGKQGALGWSQHCAECNQPRPDIARHCPICKQCVWERDHHCRYVGSCLGRDNVQAFMLMYVVMPTVTLAHLAILVGGAWWQQVTLTLFQCFQGAASLGINIFFVLFMDKVRRRRLRLKQRYPIFFSQHQDEWFD